MKKILEFFKNWFERNGNLKILIALFVLIMSIVLGRITPHPAAFAWIALISAIYLGITFVVLFSAGVINSIKGWFTKKP